MSENEERPIFQFLPDAPVINDKFGSHARVAESIAEQVESNMAGMTIGLEGTWGSGKSSVIRMLEERWKDHKNIKVFTFDAWVHEGDPLRRSFLEELTTFLGHEDRAWISRDRWQKEIDHLTKRVQKTKSSSSPQVTGWTIAFAISWLLVPVGLGAIRFIGNDKGLGWLALLSVLVLAPLGVFLAATCYECRRKDEKKDRLLNLTRLFIRKHTTETTSTASQGIEPTSIEFQHKYDEILTEVFSEPGRQLVIVMDNLDRVGPDDARKIWATMKPFVESAGSIKYDGLWVIVPYDPEAIDRIWADGEDDHDGLARAFKQKTFQVRYRVAPPLASRWEGFFKEHLKTALSNVSKDDDLHAVYHVFRIQALPAYHRGVPTPREMKLFINRVVALAQQHVSDVALPEIALYAALELSGKSLLDNLAEDELKNEQFFSDFLAPDWRECLAAIHFGVPRKDAAEVLYELKLREILQNGDAQAMQELLTEEPAQQCCERHLRDKAVEMSFSEVLAASRAFGQFTPQSASSSLRRAIGRLAHRLASIDGDAWSIGGELSTTTAEDIVRLMQFKPSISSSIAKHLSVRMPDASKAENLDAGLPEWAGGASIIVAELAKGGDFFGITIEMPEPAKYQVLLDLLAKDVVGRKVIKYVMPASNVRDAYRDHFLSQVQGGTFREEDKYILAGMLQMSCWNHNQIASLVSQAVLECLSRDGVNKDVFCRAVEFLLKHASAKDANPAFKDTLKKYGASPHVCTALQQHHGQPDAVALCVTLLLLHNPRPEFPDGQPAGQGKQQYDNILGNNDQKVAKEMSTLCVEYGLGNAILGAIQTNSLKDKAFTKTLLTELASRDTKLKALTTETFIKHHELFLAVLDTEGDGNAPNPYEELAGRLLRIEEDSLLAALESNSVALNMMRLYYLAINSDDVDTSRLEERLREYFSRDVQQDQWLKELVEGSWTLDVMLLLQRKPKGLSLDHRYANALIDHAIRMRDGSAKIDENYLVDEWASLLDCMAASEREPFHRRLVSDVVGDGGRPLMLLLPAYGEEILTAVAWLYQESNKRGKRDIESKLIRLAEHDALEHRSWLLHLLADRMDVSGMSEKTIECLCSRLKDPLKAIITQNASRNADDGDEAETQGTFVVTSDKAKELAHALGVALEDKEDTSKDDESSEQVEG